MTLNELIEHAKSDLYHIESDIQWAFHDGFNPTGTNPTEGKSGSLVSDNNEPRSGNPISRAAFHQASNYLCSADKRLAAILVAHGLTFQPKLIVPNRTDLKPTLAIVSSICWRIAEIANPSLAVLPSQFERPSKSIYLAKMTLHAAFQTSVAKSDPDSEVAIELRFCAVCGIRERQHGPRCHTCYVYKLRHDGEERPKELDNGSRPYEEAKANQAKHGIGYGIR